MRALAAGCVLIPFVAAADIAFDNASSKIETDDNNNASLTLAQGALADGYIVAGISMWDPVATVSVSAVLYDGTPMTFLGTASSASVYAEVYLFGLAVGNKPAGNYTLALTASANVQQITFGVSSFSGVHQTASTGPFASATGTFTGAGPHPTVAVGSAAGDMVVAILGYDDGTSFLGPNQTQNWRVEDISDLADGVSSRESATGSATTMSHTVNFLGVEWAIGAIALKPGGPPPPDTTPPTLVSATAVNTNTVQVLFSEPVAALSAETPANYDINNDVNVTAAVLGADTRTVTLTTSPLMTGDYMLTVNNVTDLAAVPNTIAPNSQASFSFDPNPPPPGLIAHWRFDEGAGTSAADASGNGRTGTLINGPGWAVGKAGSAVNLDGINDYVSVPNLDVTGSAITLAAWVNLASLPTSSDVRIISKASNSSQDDHWWMLGHTFNGNHRLRFRLKAGGVTTTLVASSGNLTANTWLHAAATYDGATMRLYLNGVEVGSSAKSGVIDVNPAVAVNLGRNPDGSSYVPGRLDEVRIYERSLSQQEIQQVINDSVGPPVLLAQSDLYSVTQGATLTVVAPGVLGNDSLGAGPGPLTATLTTGPTHGSLNLTNNGGFTYTSPSSAGMDSFTYQAHDGAATSGPAVALISVLPPGALFYDDFARPVGWDALTPWVIRHGSWTIGNGTLSGVTNAGGPAGHGDIYVTNIWTDYSVEVRASVATNGYGWAVGGRLNPVTGAYYEVFLYANTAPASPWRLRLTKHTEWGPSGWDGNLGLHPDVTDLEVEGAARTAPHTIKMTFQGNRILVYFDGVQRMDATDNDFPHSGVPWPVFSSGGILVGLYSDNNAVVSVEDVIVRPAVDTTPPTITSVAAVNGTTVQVLFSEPVAELSAETLANYSINNGVNATAAVLGADTATVTLTTSALVTSNYTLTINSVTDRATVPNPIAPNSQAAFSFTADTTPPTITSVTAVNATTVQVLFSEPVAELSAETLVNYGINNCVNVTAADLGADLRTVTLTTLALAGGSYTLTVNNVTDRATTPNSIVANSQIAFGFTSGDNTYEQWRQVYFTCAELSDPAVSGETCDPDGDRISNLMEYALGLNPRVANDPGRPAARIENGFLVLTCTRNKEAADVVLDVEAAILLAGPWSAAGLTQQVISDDGVIQTIKVIDSVAVGVEQSRFLRLTVQFQ